MMNWLTNNIGTICVTLVLTAVIVLIIINLIKDKKKGKSSCGYNCAHCAMAGQCHKNTSDSKGSKEQKKTQIFSMSIE